jgi:hypothetical protein
MCDVACGSLTDEAEIRDAIRRVPAGGTVVIAAGTFVLSQPLRIEDSGPERRAELGKPVVELFCERDGVATLQHTGGPVIE